MKVLRFLMDDMPHTFFMAVLGFGRSGKTFTKFCFLPTERFCRMFSTHQLPNTRYLVPGTSVFLVDAWPPHATYHISQTEV